MGAKYSQEKVDALLRENGFECLEEYKGFHISFKVKCQENHIIETFRLSDYLRNPSPKYCKYCSNKAQLSIEEVHRRVRKAGFEWVGPEKEYENQYSNLTIRCKKYHTFKRTLGNIQIRFSCPVCNNPYSKSTKVCTKCKKEKTLDNFPKAKHKRKTKKSGSKTHKYPRSTCRDCSNQRNKANRLRGRRFIIEHLLKNHCVDCGEKNPIVLEFDHRDRSTKKENISRLVQHSVKRILKEIEITEVRCGNCHRRKTAREGSHFKALS